MNSKNMVLGLFMTLAWAASSSAAVIVELKTQHNLDSAAVAQAAEFINLSASDPQRSELVFTGLKRHAGYGPEFVDGVMTLMLERTHNTGTYEAKTRLLQALPEIANSNRMNGLWKTPAGLEIKQKINRLWFSGRGEMVKHLSKEFRLYDASDWRWIPEKLATGHTEEYLPALMNVPVDQVPFRDLNQILRILSANPNLLNLALIYHLAPNRVDKIALVRSFFAEYKLAGDLGRLNFPLHSAKHAGVRDLYARVLWDIEKRLLDKDQPTISVCELARAMEIKKEDPRLVSAFFNRLYGAEFSQPVEINAPELVVPQSGPVVNLEIWRQNRCAQALHKRDS